MKQGYIVKQVKDSIQKPTNDIINKIISYNFDALNKQQLCFLGQVLFDNYDKISTIEIDEYRHIRILMLISKIMTSEDIPLSVKSKFQQIAYKLSDFDYQPVQQQERYYSDVFEQIYSSSNNLRYHKVNNEILDVVEPYLPAKILPPRNTKDYLILLRYKKEFQSYNVYRLYGFLLTFKAIYFKQLGKHLYLYESLDIEQILSLSATFIDIKQLELMKTYTLHEMMNLDAKYILKMFQYIRDPQNQLKFLKIIMQHDSIYMYEHAEIIFGYKIDEQDSLVSMAFQLVIQLILNKMIEKKQYSQFDKIKQQLRHLQQDNFIFQNLFRQLEQNQLQFVDLNNDLM